MSHGPMKPGEARVGQRVRTLKKVGAYPDVKIGTWAVIAEVVTQIPGADDDAVLIHPNAWKKHLCVPCNASDLELIL